MCYVHFIAVGWNAGRLVVGKFGKSACCCPKFAGWNAALGGGVAELLRSGSESNGVGEERNPPPPAGLNAARGGKEE